jgi:hypothetical protein
VTHTLAGLKNHGWLLHTQINIPIEANPTWRKNDHLMHDKKKKHITVDHGQNNQANERLVPCTHAQVWPQVCASIYIK